VYFSAVLRVTAMLSESCAAEGVSIEIPLGRAALRAAATSLGEWAVAFLLR
jgi:hypothetical protein